MEMLFVLLPAAALAAFVVSRWVASKQTARAFATVAEAEQDASNPEDAAVLATPSLIAVPAAPDVLRAQAEVLLTRFDSLASFDVAGQWEQGVTQVLEAISVHQAACENLKAEADKAIARYEATTSDGRDQQFRVARKTRQSAAEAYSQARLLNGLVTKLGERLELVPASRDAQRNLLRDLRAQKQELHLKERELKIRNSEARSSERSALMAAEPALWGETEYSLRRSLEERRDIRRRAEAAVRPNETEIAALQRQVIALERRIGWVERFQD